MFIVNSYKIISKKTEVFFFIIYYYYSSNVPYTTIRVSGTEKVERLNFEEQVATSLEDSDVSSILEVIGENFM